MPKVGPERSSQGRARRTTAEPHHFTGSGEFGRWIDLFTEDGAFHMLGRSSLCYPHRGHSFEDSQPAHQRSLTTVTEQADDSFAKAFIPTRDVQSIQSKYSRIAGPA